MFSCSVLHSGGQTTSADTWTQTLRPQSCASTCPRSRCSSPGEASAMCPLLSAYFLSWGSSQPSGRSTVDKPNQLPNTLSEIETVALLHKVLTLGSSFLSHKVLGIVTDETTRVGAGPLTEFLHSYSDVLAVPECPPVCKESHWPWTLLFFSFWPLPHMEDCTLHGHLLKILNLFIHRFSSFLMGILFIDSKVF